MLTFMDKQQNIRLGVQGDGSLLQAVLPMQLVGCCKGNVIAVHAVEEVAWEAKVRTGD